MTMSRAELDAHAWRWVVRMDARDWTSAEEAEFQGWLAADPKSAGAFLEAQAMWMAMDGSDTAAANDDMPVSQAEISHSRQLSRRSMLAGGAALAASVAGAVLLGGGETVYATSVGEIRRVPLADGSTAAINTASRISVKLVEAKRLVRLDEGEAWFQVAKDKSRPFIVEAGPIRVQAVGTAFSVRRRDNGADILVTEGFVDAWAEGANGSKMRLSAGQRAFVADNAAIATGPAELAAVERALAWRSGRVDFVDKPIGAAAAEFNRYNQRKLVILDPAVGQERFDGVFRIDDPDGFAVAVRDGLGVAIDRSNSDEIRIGRTE